MESVTGGIEAPDCRHNHIAIRTAFPICIVWIAVMKILPTDLNGTRF